MSSIEPEGPAPADAGPQAGPSDTPHSTGSGLAVAAESRALTLAHGHSLVVEGGRERSVLTLVDAGGAAHVSISIGPEGIRLDVNGAALSIATTGPLAIEAESVSLHGKNGIALTSGGDARIEAEGVLSTSGRSQQIRSVRGNVSIKANDDVQLDGERIRLNS